MNPTVVIFAVFVSLIATALIVCISTKVYSQLPFAPSSPSESTDNNTSSATTASDNQSSTTTTSQQQELLTFTIQKVGLLLVIRLIGK